MSKNVVILYAHPYDKSFSHGIKDVVIDAVKEAGNNPVLIDLIKDNFNPINPSSAMVKDYKNKISKADELVITYPVWWSGVPAVMQGFFSQIFTEGDFYALDKTSSIKPKNINFKKVMVFTTSMTPNIYSILGMIWPSKYRMVYGMFKPLKIPEIIFKNIDAVANSQERRERYLKKVREIVKGDK